MSTEETSPAVKVGDATNIDRLATHAIRDGHAVCNPALKAMYQGHNGEVTCKRCIATIVWKRAGRGEYIAETARGELYVQRTRDGWAYGINGNHVDETTRPLARAKELAERLVNDAGYEYDAEVLDDEYQGPTE